MLFPKSKYGRPIGVQNEFCLQKAFVEPFYYAMKIDNVMLISSSYFEKKYCPLKYHYARPTLIPLKLLEVHIKLDLEQNL